MFKLEVSRDDINKIVAGLTANGASFTETSPNNFTISGHGIIATAIYAGEIDPTVKAELTVTVVKKPFFVTEVEIENGIENTLAPASAKS